MAVCQRRQRVRLLAERHKPLRGMVNPKIGADKGLSGRGGLTIVSETTEGMSVMRMKMILICVGLCAAVGVVSTTTRAGGADTPSRREYHVSAHGDDANDGSASRPLRTISAAARLAQPGDVITVHEGVYRERINPPRGGRSDQQRIVYQAAPGERAVIKGSEVIKGWQKAQDDTWKVAIPNSFFGDFNPYRDLIHGDWFNPKGRNHHTGAVYLKGHWLTEAANLDDALKPVGDTSPSYAQGNQQYLLNVAWLRPGGDSENAGRIPAARFAAQRGVQTAPCSEGGECIGWIEQGDAMSGSTSAGAPDRWRFAPRRKRAAGSSRFGWTRRTENCWAPVRSRTRVGGNRGLRFA
jgi:hypothetical protein